MQGHDLHGIRGNGVGSCATFEQETGGFGLSEKTGEVQGGKAVLRIGVENGSVAEIGLEQIGTAERSGLENIQRLFLARNQFGQVAAATIERVHEQAHVSGVARFRGSGILFQKSPEAFPVACPEKFKTILDTVFAMSFGATPGRVSLRLSLAF